MKFNKGESEVFLSCMAVASSKPYFTENSKITITVISESGITYTDTSNYSCSTIKLASTSDFVD